MDELNFHTKACAVRWYENRMSYGSEWHRQNFLQILTM